MRNITKEELAAAVAAHLEWINSDRRNGARANLQGANLQGAHLEGAHLQGANLQGAHLEGAHLQGAHLEGANLQGAYLQGAHLEGANLEGAHLEGANLQGAHLDAIKADLYAVLRQAPSESAGLLAALRAGRVDGTVYEGDCACLVGTIANLRHETYDAMTVDLRPNAGRPAEVWFLAIAKGHTPETSQIAAITAGWIEEWISAQTPITTVAP